MNATTRPSNRPFWILLAVTGLPFIAAWIIFFNPSLMDRFSTSNHGALVTPVRPLPALEFETLTGASLPTKHLEGNWTLLSVTGSRCDENCETNLFHMRQIRLAMGEDRKRVLRVLLIEDPDNLARAELEAQLEPFEGTAVITGPREAREQLLATLDTDGTPAKDRIFLIDPLGSLMMTYPPVPEPKNVLKDLERLIQVVQL